MQKFFCGSDGVKRKSDEHEKHTNFSSFWDTLSVFSRNIFFSKQHYRNQWGKMKNATEIISLWVLILTKFQTSVISGFLIWNYRTKKKAYTCIRKTWRHYNTLLRANLQKKKKKTHKRKPFFIMPRRVVDSIQIRRHYSVYHMSLISMTYESNLIDVSTEADKSRVFNPAGWKNRTGMKLNECFTFEIMVWN